MKHITVLKQEAIELLEIKSAGIYVDATLGGAGHSLAILQQLKQGFLYAFDQDVYAINKAKELLKEYQNCYLIQANFKNMKKELKERGIENVDGIIFDLGLSSFQIDDVNRGFTYLKETKLDMRMDQQQELTAEKIINTYSKDELAKIFFEYGEEKNAYKIAQRIIDNRPIKTTFDLVSITDRVNHKEKGHSAKRVFQALRIEVNQELEVLKQVLSDAFDLLKEDGVLAIITFHSLEDRIVKHFFKSKTTIDFPNVPTLNLPEPEAISLTRKPIYPTEEEQVNNSRSRSAKLRAIKKKKTLSNSIRL